MKKHILLFIYSCLFLINTSSAQWTKITNIPPQQMVALANMHDTLYATSGASLIYKSIDGGETWEAKKISTQPIIVYSTSIIDQTIYISTINHGIFVSTDFGYSFMSSGIGLPLVTAFQKFNQNIYASTSGSGVYKYDSIINNWLPFNNDLPSNRAFDVQSMTATDSNLMIGAGANGTFFKYDFNNNRWSEYYYYDNAIPGLMFQKMISSNDTLYAVNGRRIIRSNDGGLNWVDDKTDSQNGTDRTILAGKDVYYILTNQLNGGAWIQKRSKQANIGDSWSAGEDYFSHSYTYSIIEFNNKLFLATENGLYVKNLFAGIKDPNYIENHIQLYPNPSVDGNVRVNSTLPIDRIEISNILGQPVYVAGGINYKQVNIKPNLAKGLYLVTVYLSNNQMVSNKLVVE